GGLLGLVGIIRSPGCDARARAPSRRSSDWHGRSSCTRTIVSAAKEIGMERTVQGRGHALGGGAVAGIIGGVVIAIALVVGALAKGQDVWPSFKGAAAPFLGERAMRPGFDGAAVLLGVICHFAVSIIWGVLFAAIFFGLSRGATVAAGAVWG